MSLKVDTEFDHVTLMYYKRSKSSVKSQGYSIKTLGNSND